MTAPRHLDRVVCENLVHAEALASAGPVNSYFVNDSRSPIVIVLGLENSIGRACAAREGAPSYFSLLGSSARLS